MEKLSSLYEHLLFIRKFLLQGKRIASFAPSSKTLATALCRYIDPNKPQIILELGAGTGAVTAIAAKKMHPDSILIAIEQDPEFSDFLHARCPRAKIINCNAEEMLPLLHALNIHHVDVIISALPTPSLPKSVVSNIFANCKTLMKENIPFSQITIMPWVYLRMYKRFFTKVKFEFIMKSIPSGGVYHCWELKG